MITPRRRMNDCIGWLGPVPPPPPHSPRQTSPWCPLVPGAGPGVLTPWSRWSPSPHCWCLTSLGCCLCLRSGHGDRHTHCHAQAAGRPWLSASLSQSLVVSSPARHWPGWAWLPHVSAQGHWRLPSRGLRLLGLSGLDRTPHLSLPRAKYYGISHFQPHRCLDGYFSRDNIVRKHVKHTACDSYFVVVDLWSLLRGCVRGCVRRWAHLLSVTVTRTTAGASHHTHITSIQGCQWTKQPRSDPGLAGAVSYSVLHTASPAGPSSDSDLKTEDASLEHHSRSRSHDALSRAAKQ